MDRREFIRCGVGLAGIIAAGKAPASVIKGLISGRSSFQEEEEEKEWYPNPNAYIVNSQLGAWINTNLVFNNYNFKVLHLTFMLLSEVGTRYIISGNGGSGAEYIDIAEDGYLAKYGRRARIKVVPRQKYTVTIDKNGKWCNGTNFQDVNGQFWRPYPYSLFMSNSSYTSVDRNTVTSPLTGKIRVYRFTVENVDQTVIEHDFFARKMDGEAGLFDIVNGRFHPNWGTGKFSYGREAR